VSKDKDKDLVETTLHLCEVSSDVLRWLGQDELKLDNSGHAQCLRSAVAEASVAIIRHQRVESEPPTEDDEPAWTEPTPLKQLATDPNLGLLIVQWEMLQMNAQKMPPALLTVIQRWLRKGCPAIKPGPNPLRDIGVLDPG